ncbi:MAG: NAD(P)H-dependent glycerol-3-phosphate dehydrogenase [Thiotrichaceae bacterium]
MSHSIIVLGAGAWGTALAIVLARNGHRVFLWSIDPKHVQQMQATRHNFPYVPNSHFPENLSPISELLPALTSVQEILLAVPSHAFRETLLKISTHLPNDIGICWATKGLEYDSGLLLDHLAREIIGESHPLAVLSGPSFAAEVVASLPTAVTIASNSSDYAEKLVYLFHNPVFRPYSSTDMVGVQLGGAVKNVMAIAAGITDGLQLGANTRAALITRGLAEMVRLGVALGGEIETFMGLAGLGDLVLTCTDDQSRNRRFGYALATGQSSQQAQQQIGLIEGMYAAREIQRLARRLDVDMPLVTQVCRILQDECTPQDAVQLLLSRELKREY